MNDIGERITLFINHLNISVRAFEINVGISNGLLGKVIGKKVSLGVDKVSKILYTYPELSSEWLIMGSGSMIKSGYPLAENMATHLATHSGSIGTLLNEQPRNGTKPVPFLTGDKSIMNSGNGIPYYDTLPASAGDIFSFLNQAKPASFIDLPQLTDCIAVLPVYGSSMKGIIEPGDLIAIKEVKTRNEFDPCIPYMVVTEEHRMVKYLRVDENDQMVIWAESTNHAKIRLSADNIKMVYAIKCVVRFF